MKGLRWLLT